MRKLIIAFIVSIFVSPQIFSYEVNEIKILGNMYREEAKKVLGMPGEYSVSFNVENERVPVKKDIEGIYEYVNKCTFSITWYLRDSTYKSFMKTWHGDSWQECINKIKAWKGLRK